MVYTEKFKENAIRKLLPPENNSLPEVAREMSIAYQTLFNWKNKLDRGILPDCSGKVSPRAINISERYSLLIESYKIKKKDKGRWLRENGLKSEHLILWEKELKNQVTEQEKRMKSEIKELKINYRKLQKELNKKDKALAEMAALITLKKKAEAIWGVEED